MAIKIVCDSTGGFTPQEIDELSLTVLPLHVIFADGTDLAEGNRDTYIDFYNRLKNEKTLPTTSQPSLGHISDTFSDFIRRETQVIAICLSSGLSGTFQSFSSVASSLSPKNIKVVDSLCCSVAVKFLARFARTYIDAGYSLDEVKSRLDSDAQNTGAIMVVDDLKFLKKGGRVGNISYFMGKLLNIHPILCMKNGALVAHAKIRGMRLVFERMVQELPSKMRQVSVLHCDNLEGATKCLNKIKERFGDIHISVEDLSPVIGTHLGNGAVGIIYAE